MLIFTLIHHYQNKSSYFALVTGHIISTANGALVHLELNVTLLFDKGSVPWYFSLSAHELSEEIGM